MRIEITVEGSEPVIHRLTKEKTLVGSGADCDIHVTAEGVSRKHLLIIGKDDQFFVVDQGSTNGSYVDESRLVPGQRSEFNSFFPVRLGHAVSLSLLPDPEGTPKFEITPTPSEPAAPKKSTSFIAESTSPVTVNKKAAGGTSPIQVNIPLKVTKKRPDQKKAPTKEAASVEDTKRMRTSFLIAVVTIILGYTYYYFKNQENEEERILQAKVEEKKVEQESIVKPLSFADMKLVDVVPQDVTSITNFTASSKCNTDFEKQVCTAFFLPMKGFSGTGVRKDGNVIQISLPKLSGAELFEILGSTLKWTEYHRTKALELSDPRDFIDLFLTRIEPALWTKFAEDSEWVQVIFLGQQNELASDVWFVKTESLTKVFNSVEYANRDNNVSVGRIRLDLIGGMFRRGIP